MSKLGVTTVLKGKNKCFYSKSYKPNVVLEKLKVFCPCVSKNPLSKHSTDGVLSILYITHIFLTLF